jgi:signal transduction histidine kinase
MILLIDTNQGTREANARILRTAGHEVEESSGEGDISSAAARCDLIVLGLRGSPPEAREFHERLRKRAVGPWPPVLALYDLAEDAGAPSEVQKPDAQLLEPLGVGALSGCAGALIRARTAENENNRFARELQEAQEDLRGFAFTASHDINEQVRTIAAYTSRLKKRVVPETDPQAAECLTFIEGGVSGLRSLVDSLLEYAMALEARTQPKSAVDCEAVLVWTLLKMDARLKGSDAVVTHDPLPMVTGHDASISKLFLHLIANAVKFKSPRPPQIHISAGQRGRVHEFAVRDNGIGIERRYFTQIFRPFRRLHGREIPGQGLGLAICQQIVRAHGGQLWLESAPQEGSTFFFTLAGIS